MRKKRSLVIAPFDAIGKPVLDAVRRSLLELGVDVYKFDNIAPGASWAQEITAAVLPSRWACTLSSHWGCTPVRLPPEVVPLPSYPRCVPGSTSRYCEERALARPNRTLGNVALSLDAK